MVKTWAVVTWSTMRGFSATAEPLVCFTTIQRRRNDWRMYTRRSDIEWLQATDGRFQHFVCVYYVFHLESAVTHRVTRPSSPGTGWLAGRKVGFGAKFLDFGLTYRNAADRDSGMPYTAGWSQKVPNYQLMSLNRDIARQTYGIFFVKLKCQTSTIYTWC